MPLKNNFARIARGSGKAGGILVLADNFSIMFITAAPALTAIDSAVDGCAQIPRSEAICLSRPFG